MSSTEFHTLTGPYVLDALGPDEQAAFEQHLAGCPECIVEVAELREATTKLSAEVAMAPPPKLKADVMAAISQVQQLPPLDLEPAAGAPVTVLQPRRFTRRSALALAAAALAVATSGGIAIDQYRSNTATQQRNDQIAAVLAEPDARTVHGAVTGGGQATVVASNRKDAAIVVLRDLRQLPADQTYQLWLIDPSKTAHSIGLAGHATHDQTTIIASGVTGKVAFGLTVEPAGGSAKPTMPAAAILALA
ncbi:anti-sigma factor [Kribbella catacumbae]|uniref:anti-sigma factor n=1 Tax=Kribbella catacumbae TaxID=460086 RepID=UPI0003601704|nr:anti-sigma factor [Kribbella catacumbae]